MTCAQRGLTYSRGPSAYQVVPSAIQPGSRQAACPSSAWRGRSPTAARAASPDASAEGRGFLRRRGRGAAWEL